MIRRTTFEQRQQLRSWLKGMLVVPLLHALAILLTSLIMMALQFVYPGTVSLGNWGFIVALILGLVQWVYILPLGLWLYFCRKYEFLKGVAIAALLTALLNGACFGLIRANLSWDYYGLMTLSSTISVATVVILITFILYLINLK